MKVLYLKWTRYLSLLVEFNVIRCRSILFDAGGMSTKSYGIEKIRTTLPSGLNRVYTWCLIGSTVAVTYQLKIALARDLITTFRSTGHLEYAQVGRWRRHCITWEVANGDFLAKKERASKNKPCSNKHLRFWCGKDRMTRLPQCPVYSLRVYRHRGTVRVTVTPIIYVKYMLNLHWNNKVNI